MAKFRSKMSRKRSRKSFRRGTRTHRKNSMATVMRGGYRL